ncbi:MAG TPA: RagB/SusD family nutrient uptake outer membrane protein [Longimicrobiaceae bacterium]|nr:RagB/SusD family nutrient uptake outer membrane protein [Longimicrobiaceae bacterium]
MRIRFGIALLAAALAGTGCELDLTNPNSPVEEEVVNNPEGIIALAVGMQGQYASSVLTFVRAPALVTDEWGTQTRALTADISLLTGEGLDASFGVVEAPYAAAFRVIRSANLLINNAPQVGLGRGLETGIVALAKTFKAMSIGAIAQQYDRVATDAAPGGAPLKDRMAAFNEAIALLESARADLAGVSAAELAGFRSRVVPSAFDLENTINALLARYYLFTGQHQQAIAAADRVNLARLSLLLYPDPTINPIYNYSFVARYTAGLQSFAKEAEAGDRRPTYWLDPSVSPAANPRDTLLFALRQYSGKNDPYPVYLPDEMRLIKAEALVRLGGAANFAQALALINQVRTQSTSALNEPVAALPPKTAAELSTQAALLRQIAYERRYELYMQGLRWEDLRRLGQFVDRRPTFTFLPLPTQECLANPQANCAG